MTIVQAVLLGALQGVAEFLPISSSGHLVLFRHLLGIEDIPVLFDVLLHVSTLIVICIVFRKAIGRIFIALAHFLGRRVEDGDKAYLSLCVAVIAATVVTAAVGFGISYLDAGRYPRVVSALFIVTAFILIMSRFTRGSREYGDLGVREGAITGLAQGLGVLPGISRSGIVISAALYAGITRKMAGEFAFLISIPAVLGAFILELRDIGTLVTGVSAGALAAGMIVSFIVGFASLKLVLRLLERAKIHLFAFYLIPLGIAGLILF